MNLEEARTRTRGSVASGLSKASISVKYARFATQAVGSRGWDVMNLPGKSISGAGLYVRDGLTQ